MSHTGVRRQGARALDGERISLIKTVAVMVRGPTATFRVHAGLDRQWSVTQRQFLNLNFASMASPRASTRRVTVSHAGTPDVIWLSVFFFPQGRARGVLASHSNEKKRPPRTIAPGGDPRETPRDS